MKILKKLKQTYWNIGFVENPASEIPNIIDSKTEIKWLKHSYKDGWFADPFILSVTKDKVEVLVEELYYPTQKGRISKLLINRKDYSLLDVIPLLQLETHLSFPAILRKGDNIYVYPENSESGNSVIYKLESDKMVKDKVSSKN